MGNMLKNSDEVDASTSSSSRGLVNTEIAQSHMRGIFTQETAYSIVNQ